MEGIEKIPLFDNHSHELDYEKCSYTPTELSISYLHGFRDIEGGGAGLRPAAFRRGEDDGLPFVQEVWMRGDSGGSDGA